MNIWVAVILKVTYDYPIIRKVFDSCSEELNNAMGCRPFNSPNRREHVVRLRGLPYDTEKKEIYAFFNGK